MRARTRRQLVVDVIADLICPWCYVGRHRLRDAAALLESEAEIVLRHYPFELNPAMPTSGMARRDYRIRKFGSWERSRELDARVEAVAAADGLPMSLERQVRTPSTFRAHRLLWHYRDAPVARALLDEIYRAYFVDGRDIGRVDVLAELAFAAGIGDAMLDGILDGEAHAGEVREAVDAAYAAGIHGVPAIVVEGRLISEGAEAAASLADRLRQLAVPAS